MRLVHIACSLRFSVVLLYASVLRISSAYPNFYESGSDTVALKTTKDFKEKVSNSSFLWVLQLYRESCGFCALLNPEYDKAASDLKHLVYFGAVDVEHHRNLASAVQKKYNFQVSGVPTIKLLSPGGGIEDFPGERNAKALKAAAYKAMPSFVDVVGIAKLDGWLAKGSSDVRKAVLFSAKGTVTPLFKGLSSEFRGRIAFAQVATDLKGSGADLALRFGLEQLPALVALRRDEDDLESPKWVAEKFGDKRYATLSWADGEKPSFRQVEGWLMGYGRSVRKTPHKDARPKAEL